MPATRARPTARTRSGLPTQIYRLIVDTVPQMVWTALPDGGVDYLNQRVLEYTGRPSETMEGAGWQSLVHPEDLPFALARWSQSVKSGEPYENQYRLRRADGEYRWQFIAARPLKDSAGRTLKWFGTCTDIEEQVRAAQVLARRRTEPRAGASSNERKLPESEKRLRSIMTLWSDFYWETNAEHRFTVLETGGRFETVMLVSTRLGKTRWETPSVLPDEAGWRAHRETLDARRAFRDFETARRGDDGVLHHYSIDGEPMFDERGVFRGYRGVGREITARKLAELVQRERDRRFLAFLDSMPAIAWIKDSKFRYAWISASYGRVLGRSLVEMRGRDDFEIWPDDLARRYRRDDELALRANGPVQSVENAPYAGGSTARWLVVKFPLPDESGALGVAGIGFDMTADCADEEAHGTLDSQNPLERLSGRERQVLKLIVDGHTSAQVSERLGLSPKSIDTYRSRLMAKLGIGDLPNLVKFALRNGLTTKR